ncbi:MAG: hypothetical protein H6713_11710 [Myxococcales bacterium]|nr:hypothetical protein [Myxococcales bacterium]
MPDPRPVALEAPSAPDLRTINLRRVFAPPPPRGAASAAAPRVSLEPVRVVAYGPSHERSGIVGLGWRWMTPGWLDGAVSPELAPELRAYFDARRFFSRAHHVAYLAGSRLANAEVLPIPNAWGGRPCLERFAADAQRRADESERAVARTDAALRARAMGLTPRRPGDEFVLAYLQVLELARPRPEGEAARLRGVLDGVASDESLGSELRARAAETIAYLHSSDQGEFTAALERTIALTRDPALRVDALVKLADTSDDVARAEALRAQIVELYEETEVDWQLARTLSDLASVRVERGAYALARADATRCAREVRAEFPRDPDPWGCAGPLAEAVAELAYEPSDEPTDEEVPLAFLGPLALAAMGSAYDRWDYEQAERVGRLLLAELPEAAEAPAVLARLRALATTDEARAELDELARAYGPTSDWAAHHRRRLAWDDRAPEEIARRLDALMNPGGFRWRRETAPAELADNLRARAVAVAETCSALLPVAPGRATLRVDTRGSAPRVAVTGAGRQGTRCLRRAAEARFRSLEPLRVRVELAAKLPPR